MKGVGLGRSFEGGRGLGRRFEGGRGLGEELLSNLDLYSDWLCNDQRFPGTP